MRESWTDDRLDVLNAKVDDLGRRVDNGFNRVDAELKEQRAEMKSQREELKSQREELKDQREELKEQREDTKSEFVAVRREMREGFAEVSKRLEKLDDRFHSQYRMVIGFCAVMVAALIGPQL